MRFWTTIGLIFMLSVLGLTYEIAAGRVLAPFFGTSLVTWTTVIAVVLAGFALGSALGGLVAEREPDVALRSVRMALITTAILMALSPIVLTILYTMGARGTGGMVGAVFFAFFPASVLVSIPSPYLAKLAVQARPGREGSSLGLVLAAGSLGAILGAVIAGFIALPLFGSALTFTGCGVVALLCVLGLRGSIPLPPSALVPAIAIVAFSFTNGSVCRYESGLSCVDVGRSGDEIRLFSDRTTQAAERVMGATASPEDVLVLPYTELLWTQMDRDLAPDAQVLFIGGGGYTLPSLLMTTRPEARGVTVEIDPLVTKVVQDVLPWAGAVIQDNARLDIVHADGRIYINETMQQFDAAVMDAFSSRSVPAHLVTLETYQRLRDVVAGPVYVNLIDAPDGPLARGTHAILTQVYPHVIAFVGPVSTQGAANIILTASPAPLTAPDHLPDGYAIAELTAGRAFTDDRGWVGHR